MSKLILGTMMILSGILLSAGPIWGLALGIPAMASGGEMIKEWWTA